MDMALTLVVAAEEMRQMLRIKHTVLDAELDSLKSAFLTDLELCGVNAIPEGDNLAKACLRLYLRWQQNYNGEAERYKAAYEETKIAMSLADVYKAVKE